MTPRWRVAASREAGAGGPPLTDVVRAARAALADAKAPAVDLSVTLVGGPTIRRLNARWLGKRRLTDVIAFSLDPGMAPAARPAGDVYVCVPVAARAARAHGIALREEVLRLVVHGTLHAVGFDHPAGESRVRSAMWRRQERLVSRLMRRAR